MKLSPEVTQSWIRLVRAYRSASSQVETALKQHGHPPLAWYDVLWELENAEVGLRLYELENALLLPQHNVSRLVDRLAAGGLLKKTTAPEDARGRILKITPKGAALRQAMWPVYAEALNSTLKRGLSRSQLTDLAGLLSKITS